MAESIALVPVFTGTINNQSVQLCDARTLHTFMGVLRDFSNWIKGRIKKFKFVEGIDYLLAKTGEQVPHQGGIRNVVAIDYHLTLDMAKELAMVENNDKGREARRYFIACEKQAQLLSNPEQLPSDRISPAQAQHLKELVDIIVASGKQDYPSTWARFQRKFKINKYELLHPSQFDAACEYLKGKMDGQSMAALVQKHFPDATKMVPAQQQLPLNTPEQPAIDMERIRQTMIAANEVAAKVQAVVFFEMLAGQKNWQNERWCLSFVVDGRNDTAPPTPRAWQIESDAVIAPLLKLASDIGKEGGILLATIQDLLALNSASSQALSRRLAAGVNVR